MADSLREIYGCGSDNTYIIHPYHHIDPTYTPEPPGKGHSTKHAAHNSSVKRMKRKQNRAAKRHNR